MLDSSLFIDINFTLAFTSLLYIVKSKYLPFLWPDVLSFSIASFSSIAVHIFLPVINSI